MLRKFLLLATTALIGLAAVLVATPANAVTAGVPRFVAPAEGATVAAGFRGPITVDLPTSSLIFTVQCWDADQRTYDLRSRITGGPGLVTRYLDDPIATQQLSHCTASVGDEQGNYRADVQFQVAPDPNYRPNAIWSTGGQLPDGCANVPVWFSFDRPSDTVRWEINLDVYAPDGSWSDSDYGYGAEDGGDSVSGLLHAYICRYEGAGQYTMKATIDWRDRYGDKRGSTSATGSFVIATLPPAPSTPPPAPYVPPVPHVSPSAPVFDVSGTFSLTKTPRAIEFRFKAFKMLNGTRQRDPLVWTVKVDGKMTRTIVQDAGDVDYYTVRRPRHTGRHKVVVHHNHDEHYTYSIKT